MQLPGTVPEASRAQSRAHLEIDLDSDLHGQHHPHGSHLSHDGHPQAHAIHSHGAHSAQSSAGLPPAGFASHIPPASSGPMPMDWNMYHVPTNLQLNHPQFDFEVPGHMSVVGHSTHLSHAPTNPASFSYGSNLVSPSSIHPSSTHFDTGIGSQWDDSMSHDASTPKVRTPVHQVASNPWAEIDEPAGDNNATSASRPRKTPRPRRQKKEARKLSDASQGGGSSSTGGTAPSISDAASPSSASQNSRASIGSKSASMASTVSTTSSRQSKLRSASRTSKNTRDKPNDTPEDRRTRASHNLVEKQYRNRLNAQFESLLNALPEQARHGDGGSGNGNEDNESDHANDVDRRVSKGEVLEMARKHIQALERERSQLELENLELQGNLRRLKESKSESIASSSGQENSIDPDTNKEPKRESDDENENGSS
ncbi:Allergen Fus c 3 [Fusarium beomiforme]|uniref:Allergen Fus c 3 n=1 Tax=Fusarium beomiforme TaxID=44412 RepID=A0A9P5AGA2_9HYPO|nr:Allergen Fus c 3 [Fusarium beomiforme]